MSHYHWCDVAGHSWECPGMAVRPDTGTLVPSPCICIVHGVSMDEGDHRACPVEMIACPQHRSQEPTVTHPAEALAQLRAATFAHAHGLQGAEEVATDHSDLARRRTASRGHGDRDDEVR